MPFLVHSLKACTEIPLGTKTTCRDFKSVKKKKKKTLGLRQDYVIGDDTMMSPLTCSGLYHLTKYKQFSMFPRWKHHQTVWLLFFSRWSCQKSSILETEKHKNELWIWFYFTITWGTAVTSDTAFYFYGP